MPASGDVPRISPSTLAHHRCIADEQGHHQVPPQHPPMELRTGRQLARKAQFRWPIRHVPDGCVGVVPDTRSAAPCARAILPPGWHFVTNGRLAVVADQIDTGEWPVSPAPEADPAYWVRATCIVDDPGVAAFVVADVPTAIVQQLRTAVRVATSGGGSIASEDLAKAVRELVEPILLRWGVAIHDLTVRGA